MYQHSRSAYQSYSSDQRRHTGTGSLDRRPICRVMGVFEVSICWLGCAGWRRCVCESEGVETQRRRFLMTYFQKTRGREADIPTENWIARRRRTRGFDDMFPKNRQRNNVLSSTMLSKEQSAISTRPSCRAPALRSLRFENCRTTECTRTELPHSLHSNWTTALPALELNCRLSVT